MNRTAAALLILGALTLVTGVALFSARTAVVLAGVIMITAGVLSLERKTPSAEVDRR